MKKVVLCFIVSCCFIGRLIAFPSDTLRLYYDINVSALNSSQYKQIDAFLLSNNFRKVSSVNIFAYADFLSTASYNRMLSQHRADNVKQYLITKGYFKQINQCIGKGELPPELNNYIGIPENRRLEIVLQYQSETMIKSSETIENIKNVEIRNAKEGDHILLKNLNFQPGRHFLTLASQPELEVLLKNLVERPTLKIEIQGHICCEFVGKDGLDQDTYTWDLSLHRAKYIYDFLIKNGIAADRLQYKGFASSKPLVYPEKTSDDQNKNRRVEILILKE